MHYKFYVKNPSSHYLYIDLTLQNINTANVLLQLPAWRPGRYELGNFAKNIKKLDVFNEKGDLLNWRKKNKDLWEIETNGAKEIKVTYSYYSADLNAGSTYVDDKQVYVNPVNCCMYVVEKMDEEHVVELEIPDSYVVAGSMEKRGNKTLVASNFDELADSPFMCSAQIQTLCFSVNGINFYLHFNGECKPKEDKLKDDFVPFIQAHFDYYGDAPFNEYHFLFQVLNNRFYHGVEHLKSTVIALGPGYNLMSGDTYLDLLGVSCHELFHAWNIKSIRPVEMLPYDYTKENYSRTGFIYEGVTTYYGDKLLFCSKVFTEQQYFTTLEERLNKHFHNYGRYNLTLADSSLDTWLDGYVPGAPYRKVSIYDEGNLVAFMLDVLIMRDTNNDFNLKHVMNLLYNDFHKKGKGYSEADINSLVAKVAGKNYDEFFNKYVYGFEDYEQQLNECLNYIGLEIDKKHSDKICERYLGFKSVEHGQYKKVSLVAPYSPAWKAQLSPNDEIIAVNGHQIKSDFNQWLTYYSEDGKFTFGVLSNGILKNVDISFKKEKEFFANYQIKHLNEPTSQQKQALELWLKV